MTYLDDQSAEIMIVEGIDGNSLKNTEGMPFYPFSVTHISRSQASILIACPPNTKLNLN